MNEPRRSREESPERKPDPGGAVARALPAAWSAVCEPDQRAGVGQDPAAREDAGAYGQERRRRRADGGPADGERRPAAGEIRLSGEADCDRRYVSPRRPHGGKAPGRLEAGRTRPADRGERGKPGVSVELRPGRGREDRAAEHDRRKRQAAEVSVDLF